MLLSGGNDENNETCAEVFLFDTQISDWVVSPAQPSLVTARYHHASCATESAAFVYGGADQDQEYLDQMEYQRLDEKHDWLGRKKMPQWTSFTIKNFVARNGSLMTAVSTNLIMIFGGSNIGQLSDGVLVDTDRKRVVRSLNTQDLGFTCPNNHCCLTEHDTVVAVVEAGDRSCKLIEIATKNDYKFAVLQDLA